MLKIRNVQVKDTEKATCLELSAMSYLSKFLYGCLTQQLVVTSLMVIITLKGRWLLLSLSHEWKKKKKNGGPERFGNFTKGHTASQTVHHLSTTSQSGRVQSWNHLHKDHQASLTVPTKGPSPNCHSLGPPST